MKTIIRLPLIIIGLYLLTGIVTGLVMFSAEPSDDAIAAIIYWPLTILFGVGGQYGERAMFAWGSLLICYKYWTYLLGK